MKRRTWLNRGVRGLALGAVLALMVGDGARSAANGGIDPLEVLKLSVKPNVFVVLDSSGSMQQPPAGGTMLTGDWTESKMHQAKQVLKTVVQQNDTKVNFMFGQYTQTIPTMTNSRVGTRFLYMTTDTSMASDELYLIEEQSGANENLGFQAWQDIRPGWGTLYFGESVTTTTGTFPTITIDATRNRFYFAERIGTSTTRFAKCDVTLPASLYGVYDDDTELTALAAALTARLQSGTHADRVCRRTDTNAVYNLVGNYTMGWTGSRFRWSIGLNYVIFGPGETDTIVGVMGLTDSVPTGQTFGGTITARSSANPYNFPVIASSTTTTAEVICPVDVLAAANSVSLGTSMPAALGSGRFFQLGADLATAMTNGMNACTGRGAAPNTYTVTYDPSNSLGLGLDGGFRFSRSSGSQSFRMRWADGPNNIAGALNMAGQANTSLGNGPFLTGDRIGLLRRYDNYQTTANGTIYYWAEARRFFNGEKFYVTSSGVLCGQATTRTPTDPPSFELARVSDCASTTELHTVKFELEGGSFGASNTCNGFQSRVALGLCDGTTPQFDTIGPLLDNELQPGSVANDYAPLGYTEAADGSWNIATQPPRAGIVAEGSTPISHSLQDLQGIWSDLWNGVPNPAINGAVDAISGHTDPKERTVILFVTDGDDTCAGTGDSDDDALAAAYEASLLYDPLVGGVSTPSGNFTTGSDPASSVTTYVIGYGTGASANRLNWIAWGGSGMRRNPTTSNGVTHWNGTPTATNRTQCKTCVDAFQAPDAATLANVLQSLIDQGATSGAFTAQQSITANVFELGGEVTGYNSFQPQQRYNVIIPTLFQASFELPGYKGHLRAFQNESGVSVEQWDAGDKLVTKVTTGIAAVNEVSGAGTDQLTFAQLHGGATDLDVGTLANVGIRRRIYTTDRNGYYDVVQSGASPFAGLFAGTVGVYDGTNHGRVRLWPPTTADAAGSVAPDSYTREGLLDPAMGLPSDSTISGWTSTQQTTEFTRLQTTFGACKGGNLNTADCASGTLVTKLKAARREAREIMLAFLAGAEPVPDVNADPTRVPPTGSPTPPAAARHKILYQARSWILAESSLAPPAVVAPPIGQNPPVFTSEYQYYANGFTKFGSSTKANALAQGYGLRSPDAETGQAAAYIDTRTTLKPAMTVAYIGTNAMLHAFRAGPSCNTPGTGNAYSSCAEQGGEELWGFLPYDQLGKLEEMRKPQKRETKTYVVAAPVRFADVFVPVPTDLNGSTTEEFSVTIDSGTISNLRGVWRQVLYFGRGAGGKYLTALDVTNRGPFTSAALASNPPIPWWNRGNPDTFDGRAGGTATHSAADTTAYSKMGETWSVPAIAFVDATKNVTTRRPYDATANEGGVGVVAYVGSGYSDVAGEGATFYTLDALNGDPVAAVDVDAQATTDGVSRSGLSYKNALVAPPAAFSKGQLSINQTTHPADQVTRVYIGDLHGRLWKFVSADPTKAVLMADLGEDQAVGVGAALIALNEVPYVYVAAGNDSRATGPFKFFGFRDDGSDTDTTHGTPGPATGDSSVQVASPAVFLFSTEFDTNFRGTLQPATAFTNANPPAARVFFGGTRFNEPGTLFAPDPYPCRSSFDSVIYAVGAETGGAAYDFGGDSFLVLENSRKTALQIIKEPATPGSPPGTTGGSRLIVDEGLMSGGAAVVPPPPPGEQPKTIAGIPAVSFAKSDVAKRIPIFPQGTPPRVCQ